MTNDHITRGTAAAILLLAFVGSLAVVVHGFWLNPAYTIPPLLAAILGSLVFGAGGVLGFRVGTAVGAQTAAAQPGSKGGA